MGVVSNQEVIAVNQDVLGMQGRRIKVLWILCPSAIIVTFSIRHELLHLAGCVLVPALPSHCHDILLLYIVSVALLMYTDCCPIHSLVLVMCFPLNRPPRRADRSGHAHWAAVVSLWFILTLTALNTMSNPGMWTDPWPCPLACRTWWSFRGTPLSSLRHMEVFGNSRSCLTPSVCFFQKDNLLTACTPSLSLLHVFLVFSLPFAVCASSSKHVSVSDLWPSERPDFSCILDSSSIPLTEQVLTSLFICDVEKFRIYFMSCVRTYTYGVCYHRECMWDELTPLWKCRLPPTPPLCSPWDMWEDQIRRKVKMRMETHSAHIYG